MVKNIAFMLFWGLTSILGCQAAPESETPNAVFPWNSTAVYLKQWEKLGGPPWDEQLQKGHTRYGDYRKGATNFTTTELYAMQRWHTTWCKLVDKGDRQNCPFPPPNPVVERSTSGPASGQKVELPDIPDGWVMPPLPKELAGAWWPEVKKWADGQLRCRCIHENRDTYCPRSTPTIAESKKQVIEDRTTCYGIYSDVKLGESDDKLKAVAFNV